MILYPRNFSGLPLLLTCAGSALPRAIVPAIFSAAFAVVLETAVSQETLNHLFDSPYPYQVFAYTVAFALVFRTNVAYNRYWEGITELKTFSAKWGDAAALTLSYDCHAKPGASGEPPPTEGSRSLFAALLVHRFSLLHALAHAHLRREVELRAMPAARANVGEAGMREVGGEAGTISRFAIVCQFAALLCKCSNFFLACRHSTARYEAHMAEHPMEVIGGVADGEKQRLAQLDSEARVFSEFAAVLGTINARRAAGGCWVDPPAVSRIHQTLSNGMLGFQQACKLEDTPFPFPYAQLVSFVLFVFGTTYPLIACSKASGESPSEHIFWLPPTLSFFCTLTYFGFHEVARELEDPFLHPPNELPMVSLHNSFNNRMLTTWETLEGLYADHASAPDGLANVDGTPAKWLLTQWDTRKDRREGVGPPAGEVGIEMPGLRLSDRSSLTQRVRSSRMSTHSAQVRHAAQTQRLSAQLLSVP